MKRILLIILLLVYTAVGLFLHFRREEPQVVTPPPHQFDSSKMLSLVSDWRVANGLNPISQSEKLCKVASERLQETEINWSHTGFSASRVCGSQACDVGENLAQYYRYEGEVLTAWEKSPTHYAVLSLPSYRYGCVAEENEYIVLLLSNVDLK